MCKLCVEFDRHVATGNIEPDARHRDLIAIGDYAPNRLRIAEVAISANDASNRVAVAHAVPHLRDRTLVVMANDGRVRSVGILRRRRLQSKLLSCDVFIARGLPIIDPGRTSAPFTEPAIGINPGGEAELTARSS
jgi:hypothetical protein